MGMMSLVEGQMVTVVVKGQITGPTTPGGVDEAIIIDAEEMTTMSS